MACNLGGFPFREAPRGNFSSQRNLPHLAKHFFLAFLFLLRAKSLRKSFRLDTPFRHNDGLCNRWNTVSQLHVKRCYWSWVVGASSLDHVLLKVSSDTIILKYNNNRVGSHLKFQTVQNETFQSVPEVSGTYRSSSDLKSTSSMTSEDFSEVYWYSGLQALFVTVFQTSVDFLCKTSYKSSSVLDISIVSSQTTLWNVAT